MSGEEKETSNGRASDEGPNARPLSERVDRDAGLEETETHTGVGASVSLGSRIGKYRILRPLGEGGFGAVYLAEQERPVKRRVALKVIKAGMDTRQVLSRFEAERQALAIMDHPNIAKVFDAGATQAGRPYFAMELVQGEPITQYCDRHQFSVRQRLELFGQICQAIQHAHQSHNDS